MYKWIMSGIVTIACVFGVFLLAQGLPEKPHEEVLPEGVEALKITATNFEFNQKEYHVKAGTTYKIQFANTLGKHGFEVEGLDISMSEANPSMEYTFTEPGEYKLYCSIMCGQGHGDMVSKIIVS